MSILEETSQNVKIESSSQDFTQCMQTEPHCTNAYKKQSSHANQDGRNTQNSLSTTSHINALQAPGHFPSKVQEYLESTQKALALVKSSSQLVSTTTRKKFSSYLTFPNLRRCTPVEYYTMPMTNKQENSTTDGTSTSCRKDTKIKKMPVPSLSKLLTKSGDKRQLTDKCSTFSGSKIQKKEKEIRPQLRGNGKELSDTGGIKSPKSNNKRNELQKRKKKIVKKKQEVPLIQLPVQQEKNPPVLNTATVTQKETADNQMKKKGKKRKISFQTQLKNLKKVREEYNRTKGKEEEIHLKCIFKA